ncbi:TetR/AcrR family transcriptional regulator [Actinokineospora enzanensis]|uniref:TetR/AcrR family transcriptional regulator n=1 Tax=Actinokineospora enzanensis TaxID=155975 RepID=UPI000362F636|nr:TetR family transcriptional regulator [Actinokineospora enzanensis]
MATYASVGGKRPRIGQQAVTPERVVAAALALTRAHGLEAWTLRQLAAAVGAYPAVVYHHVGDREAVVAAVLDRVVAQLPVPAETLPWRPWFEELLRGARPVLLDHPGVARRLAVHGALVPGLHGLIDRGVRVLRRSGFGEHSAPAYTLLVDQAWLLIAAENDRGPRLRERAAIVHDELCARTDAPGLAELGRFHHAHADADLFGYALARCLDGVAALADTPSTPIRPSQADGQRGNSSFSSTQLNASVTDS